MYSASDPERCTSLLQYFLIDKTERAFYNLMDTDITCQSPFVPDSFPRNEYLWNSPFPDFR
jgi:catalase (peroxidase I)